MKKYSAISSVRIYKNSSDNHYRKVSCQYESGKHTSKTVDKMPSQWKDFIASHFVKSYEEQCYTEYRRI